MTGNQKQNTDQAGEESKKNSKSEAVDLPAAQAFLVRTLLNYDAPHYFARFTVLGCPPGLEILNKYEHLLINRRIQNLIDLDPDKRLMAYSQFDVTNSRGMQLYIGIENVKRRSLKWTRDARHFNVNFFDFHCRKIFSVRRKFSLRYCFAQYLCLLCTFGFKGCGNVAEVILGSDNSKLGTIKQKLSFSSTILNIYDNKGKCIMVVQGVPSDGILDVNVPDEDDPVAMIETLMNDNEAFDMYRVVVPRYSSPYGITFFKSQITPEQKALLVSTVILLDFIMLKANGDYPHLAEVIPDDFQEFPIPNAKLQRDGSKELVFLTEKRRRVRKKSSLLKGRWGCCIWCGNLLCICWLIGMKRNALRCTFLFLLIVAVVVIFVFGGTFIHLIEDIL